MVHFWIFGFALSYSNFGMSNGHEIMQKRQPMHLPPSQATAPSGVLCIARVKQADTQAGCRQCMHCRFTVTGPSSV